MDLSDPNIQLIMRALSTVGKDTVSEAVKDAYHGLRDLIKRRFEGKPKADMILHEYEQKPDVWAAPLEAELIEVEAAQDPEIVKAAQRIMFLANPQIAANGGFNIQFGDNA